MISQDDLEKLWAQGYTLARRMADPTNLTPAEIPASRSYQWMHLEYDRDLYARPEGATPSGWAPVPNDRHPGRFAPWGTPGNIVWNGLGLFEKPKFEVDAEHAANHAKAHQQSADKLAEMAQIVADAGYELIGAGAVVNGDAHINPSTKTIETTVRLPKDMQAHTIAIFEERDRLAKLHVDGVSDPDVMPISARFREYLNANPEAPQWPTLYALMLPKAIENVRARLASPPQEA